MIATRDDRDEDRVANRMLDALQLVSGLINLYEGYGRYSHGGGRGWTEGGFWNRPNQFVFRGRRSRAEERLWYNPTWDEHAWKRNPPQMASVVHVAPRVRRALTALAVHPFRDPLWSRQSCCCRTACRRGTATTA